MLRRLTRCMVLLLLFLCPLWVAAAGESPMSLTFQNGTTAFSTGATGSANYLVSANPSLPSGISWSLLSSNYAWATQVTTGTSACTTPAAPICAKNFILVPGSSCCLMLSLNGAGLAAGSYSLSPVIATTPSTYKYTVVSPTPITVSAATAANLSLSVSSLALSVNDTGTNTALTGHARQVTITNTSATATANNVTFTPQNLAPANPTIVSNATPNTACGDILPQQTCVLTITPTSATPSATPYNPTPTPITLTISGTNTNSTTLLVNILTYGSVYQSGYVYSIDDVYVDAPMTGSVGGKVASLTDQAAPYTTAPQSSSIIWSSNGNGFASANVSYDIVPLIAEVTTSNASYSAAQITFNATYNTITYTFPSSSVFSTCSGATNGSCNSANILALYNHSFITNYGIAPTPYRPSSGPTPLTDYAAGLCAATIDGQNGWYLPAICEMDAIYRNVTCPAGTQSMVVNLSSLIGDRYATLPGTSCPNTVNCLAGVYWSSTENSTDPQLVAWFENFSTSVGGNFQNYNDKNFQLGVRCSRALTL